MATTERDNREIGPVVSLSQVPSASERDPESGGFGDGSSVESQAQE